MNIGTNSGVEDKNVEIIDMKEAIEILNTTRSTFYRWLREGKIRGMKVGRQWRFYREDIERFLKGEEPRIDLPADISPLINSLCEYAKEIGVEEAKLPDISQAGVAEAVDLMIRLAGKINASDIHLAAHIQEGREEKLAVLRYRVDGALRTIVEIDMRLLPAIIERWKIIANCDIHEREKPQDGRIDLPLEDRKMDMRLTFLPTALGESLTVRILPDSSPVKLENIGFSPHDYDKIQRWLKAPWGMIIISGPTGSGKTTVLYACLKHISKPHLKVLTVEEPVEILLPWAVQIPIKRDAGFASPDALRAALRSDPDVIMVGEIRDHETLKIAHECALTGHLVLTSMHTPGAEAVLKRMVDLDSKPYVIGESTKLIIAQRLIRKLCPDCSVEEEPSEEFLRRAMEIADAGGLDWNSLPKTFRKPVGCDNCKWSGYRGRTIIAETLEVTPEIILALENGASLEEMRAIAVKQGMVTIAADGIRRTAMGITSPGEVIRVVGG